MHLLCYTNPNPFLACATRNKQENQQLNLIGYSEKIRGDIERMTGTSALRTSATGLRMRPMQPLTGSDGPGTDGVLSLAAAAAAANDLGGDSPRSSNSPSVHRDYTKDRDSADGLAASGIAAGGEKWPDDLNGAHEFLAGSHGRVVGEERLRELAIGGGTQREQSQDENPQQVLGAPQVKQRREGSFRTADRSVRDGGSGSGSAAGVRKSWRRGSEEDDIIGS